MKAAENNKETEAQDLSMVFHPYNVLMILVIASLSVLFLSLSGAFIYSRVTSDLPPIKLPGIFVLNTLILLASSGTMYWAKMCYLKDRTRDYQYALLATILISLVFLFMQYLGWKALFRQDILINSDNSASYLYLISGLHFAHVIGGLPFLGMFLWAAKKKMKNPVSVLVYFSDPEKKLKLRLLTLYWHFLDGLWIYLVLFFWINYLIR